MCVTKRAGGSLQFSVDLSEKTVMFDLQGAALSEMMIQRGELRGEY